MRAPFLCTSLLSMNPPTLSELSDGRPAIVLVLVLVIEFSRVHGPLARALPSYTSPLSMNLPSFHYGVAGLFPFLLLLLRLLLL